MKESSSPQLNNPAIVRAWYVYDWANSVYALVISSILFPVYYKAVTTVDGRDTVVFLGFEVQNSVLYTYVLSFSFLLVAAMLPLLSGVADYTGDKKRFMKFFVFLGATACCGLYFFTGIDSLTWGLLCATLASVGYSGSLVFYDAFLPEIVTEDRYDTTSARGYAMGYYGGIVLMVICLAIIMNAERLGFGVGSAAELNASRLSFVLTGLWWVGFSIIPFRYLPSNIYSKPPSADIWKNGYREISKVWHSLKGQPDLRQFIIAFFFYNSGVQTVMYLAALFGTDVLHLKSDILIAVFLIIQLVGAFGAWMFARISRVQGNRSTLIVMNVIWIGICVGAYFTTTANQFYVLAVFVGMVMGGIQSLSRATYSKLIPADTVDHASYFSFYDVAFNISIVIGVFSYGFIDHITGNMRYSALFLSVYFVVGLLLLWGVKTRVLRAPTVASHS
ncbi:MFS transporter [Chryseolinea sp. T2]|uniref:MFS transporter n=1 Tax=Chryseolinea sp. T2 TaxID=3129255 RepID=UPI003077BBA6